MFYLHLFSPLPPVLLWLFLWCFNEFDWYISNEFHLQYTSSYGCRGQWIDRTNHSFMSRHFMHLFKTRSCAGWWFSSNSNFISKGLDNLVMFCWSLEGIKMIKLGRVFNLQINLNLNKKFVTTSEWKRWFNPISETERKWNKIIHVQRERQSMHVISHQRRIDTKADEAKHLHSLTTDGNWINQQRVL